MIRKFTPQIPVVIQENENTIVLANDYFTVTHEKNAGGSIASLIFKNGTGNNFFQQPVFAHVALKKDGQISFFRQSSSTAQNFSCAVQKNGVKIFTDGQLTNENGKTIPVRFKQTFFYQAWGRVNVSLELIIDEEINNVYEIGVCGFYVPEQVDTLGVRPGCPPPPPDGYYREMESNLRWHDLTRKRSFAYQYSASDNRMPSYFCLFQKGGEGFEFWREDCGETWDRPFGLNPGSGVFLDDSKRLQPGQKYIRVEPFNSWVYPRTFQPGKATFNYTLGLPFIKTPNDARKAIFNLSMQARNWPTSREQMKKLADGGIQIIRLHDDNTFITPSWRDCYYPPYDEENMKMMDQNIEWAHEFGIKIVPYFSLKEFHPDCPEYPENAHHWNRWTHSDGRILTEEGPYGGYMCMKSGWLDFLKSTIVRVLKNHKFDGVYYDHLWFRYCNHPEHANGLWHNDADEILDFLFWSREQVGEEGVVYLHTSACPTIIGENLANLMIIGEDMSYARPTIDTFPPDMDFMPITNRIWCPAAPCWRNEDKIRESVLITVLKHTPPSNRAERVGFVYELGALFKKYRLNDMYRHEMVRLPAGASEHSIFVNIYTDDTRMVLFCANLLKTPQNFTFELPAGIIPAGKTLKQITAVERINVAGNAPDFTQFQLECPAEDAGIIEIALQ